MESKYLDEIDELDEIKWTIHMYNYPIVDLDKNNYNELLLSNNKIRIIGNKMINLTKYTNIIHLNFDHEFNQKVDGLLPPNLTHLMFDGHFNQPINNLPSSLIYLYFGATSRFNQEINNLPPNLTHLKLSHDFNQSLDQLPQSLIVLILGSAFNQSLDNLPNSLKSIYIYLRKNYINLEMFPENIIRIYLNGLNGKYLDKIKNSKFKDRIKHKYFDDF